MSRVVYLTLAISFIWLSCSERTIEKPDLDGVGLDYFPMEVGKFWIYQHDSIIYNPEPGFILKETSSQEMRITVVDTFVGLDGKKNYSIERAVRDSINPAWSVKDIWACEVDESRVIWKEENLHFIKMIFPISRQTSAWDGNALIDEDQEFYLREELLDYFKLWDGYRYAGVDETETIGTTQYLDVTTVLHVDEDIIYHRRFSQEKFAKNVGLVHRYVEILDTQNDDLSVPFRDRAEKGFILETTLISHN